jgi:SAM-dependent methyltransferase
MADGRDVAVWDGHAAECRESGRQPALMNGKEWLRVKVLDCVKLGAKTALDLGCGPGYWINLFGGLKYTGLDQSTGMLSLAQELSPEAEFVHGNGRSASEALSGRKFDVVFTASVLQHNRHYPDKEEIVEQISSLLVEGGYFICTENTFRKSNYPPYEKGCMYTDGYSFTPEGWEDFMGKLGFDMLEYNGESEYVFRKR